MYSDGVRIRRLIAMLKEPATKAACRQSARACDSSVLRRSTRAGAPTGFIILISWLTSFQIDDDMEWIPKINRRLRCSPTAPVPLPTLIRSSLHGFPLREGCAPLLNVLMGGMHLSMKRFADLRPTCSWV